MLRSEDAASELLQGEERVKASDLQVVAAVLVHEYMVKQVSDAIEESEL
jgi:hypothetical protein